MAVDCVVGDRVRMSRRRGRLYRARKAGLVVGALLGSYVALSCALFVWPTADAPRRVDAVVSLDGPGEAARERLAVSLVERGIAPVLVFSQGAYHSTPCPVVPRVKVICFTPVPGRTVGEVEFAARLARGHHWGSLLVVPGHEQATRARLLMRRCFTGRVLVTPAPLSVASLPYEVLYESAALAKALVWDRRC